MSVVNALEMSPASVVSKEKIIETAPLYVDCRFSGQRNSLVGGGGGWVDGGTRRKFSFPYWIHGRLHYSNMGHALPYGKHRRQARRTERDDKLVKREHPIPLSLFGGSYPFSLSYVVGTSLWKLRDLIVTTHRHIGSPGNSCESTIPCKYRW